MATYYAAVYREEDGGFSARIPDLEGCFTQADTLEELDGMLRDALFVYLDACREDGDVIPESRGFKDVLGEVEQEEGFHGLVLVSAPEQVKRVRKNVMFTEHDLLIIDNAAKVRNMDRSEFLARAAKEVASGNCRI